MDLVEVADAIFREYFFYSVDTKRISMSSFSHNSSHDILR